MNSVLKRALLPLLMLALAHGVSAQTQDREIGTTAMAHDAFQLTPSAPSATRNIVVDATSSFSVSILAASQTLRMSLVGPDNARYTVGDPVTATFESGFFPIDAPTTRPGASYLITITDPMAGAWRLEVSETATLGAPLDVLETSFFNNATWVVLAGGGEDFPVGANVRLAITGFDGTAKIRPLSIDAKVFRPFDPTFTPAAVAFRDDGVGADEVANDGIYEAFINPGTAGTYQVQADVSGTASSGAFVRSAATELRIVPHNTTITGFTDRGIDTNFDGLLDFVGIKPTANITKAATYDVSVKLRASNGHEVQRTVRQAFGIGTGSVEVTFSADLLLSDLAVNGPWAVAEVKYFEVVGDDDVPSDIRYDLGNTAAYTLAQLQHARLRLNGAGSATGVDFNSNGKFDQLNVSLGVTSDFGGSFQYSVALQDKNGKELGFRAGFVFFAAGDNTLAVSFPGFPIGENGVDGPYFLSNLVMFGSNGSLVEPNAFTTQPFLASQFEGFHNDTTPPTVSVTLTPNVLWPVNHQLIEITANVTATDDTDPNPTVSLAGVTSNQGQNAVGDGNTSPDIVIDNGHIFLRAERTGTAQEDRVYTITFTARDAAGNIGTGSATVTVPHDQRK